MIHDVIITPLKIINDDRGKVMHMLRSDSKVFKNLVRYIFQLFTKIKLKDGTFIKSVLNYTCVTGEVKLVLFDDRLDSPTKNKYQEIILSQKLL